MKALLFILFILGPLLSAVAQPKTIVVSGHDQVKSVATSITYLVDQDRKLSLEDVIESPMQPLPSDKPDFSFTTADIWLQLRIYNATDTILTRYLELARPVTNTAVLFHPVHEGTTYDTLYSGDGVTFNRKQVAHRNTVFSITLPPHHLQTFYIRTGSDGEALNIPVRIYTAEAFRLKDYTEQLALGIYYGILIFVALIYFFFYARLGEKSFLFYVLYVIGVGLLQFSLDGFGSQFLFPGFPYLGNRLVLLSAVFSLYFLVRYARSFLNTEKRTPIANTILKMLGWAAVLFVPMILSKGILYEISYPVVNLLSLAGLVTILITIFILNRRGYKVSGFFTLALFFLAAGAIVFILNNVGAIPYGFFSEFGMKIGTGLEVIFLSFSMANKFRELQKEKEKAQALALQNLQEMNRLKDDINKELEIQVKERTREIESQKEIIEEKNKDITSSIRYAKRIQEAILPDRRRLFEKIPDHFILFKPKDIVSGDFYWFSFDEDDIYIAAVDCTGHGVPGAFMSLIGNTFLNEVITESEGDKSPGPVLNNLRSKVISALNRNEGTETKDGMDMGLLRINKEKGFIEFAGAQNPCYYVRNNSLEEIKGTKSPVGIYAAGEAPSFETHRISMLAGDVFYLLSDGYADQFGGEDGKKFKYARLKKLLVDIHHLPMLEQEQRLDSTFEKWRGELEQVDDVCVIGIRI